VCHTNLPLKLDILSPRPEGGEIESGKEEYLVSMGYQYQYRPRVFNGVKIRPQGRVAKKISWLFGTRKKFLGLDAIK